MRRQTFSIVTCLALLMIALWGLWSSPAQAAPANPTDETKVPHYYGPYPNWALSQLPVGTCSISTATSCTFDAACPSGETCNRAAVTGGIKKFQDTLPLLCNPAAAGSCEAAKNNLGQYIPLAVPDTTSYADADYFVIALVQHRERMSSSLPVAGTLLREYVQLSTPNFPGKQVPLMNDLPDGTSVPVLLPDGTQAYGVDDPHYLGPVIAATKDKPVRILFYNLLPTGSGGNLFLPVDSTMMGSGMGPMAMMEPMDAASVMDVVRNPDCTEVTKADPMSGCFKDNRATLHLHGGITPWISDGTPHQWITPASEDTPWPKGVSVKNVPDMPDPGPGAMTFFYTNQQSARLMFYHDHSWGITRLNVYAGEAAGYLISDPTEQRLLANNLIPDAQLPLIIQDRTFVPDPAQMAALDPTWDYTRWGKEGDLWYHHVYMPAQNPADLSGMSAYGRWMYGPWFWPPATPPHPPIPNPYYDPNCNIDDPTTWQYQVDPFCESPQIPGTPNISVGMEQFNDTPIVNGTAYPTTTVEPKAYRLRILNAANDRFFNLQLYVADPTTGTESEVALNATELAAAQLDPNVFPTPDTTLSPAGPNWIQIGSEGGFLPAPAVIPPRPITWISDPTRFDVGNVDQTSLALAPAERADVIVDFSQYAGKTLILYNDAPAAYPARVSSYDYYTGAPDLSPIGAPPVLPGYGPNTRTVMQIKVANTAPAAAFNLAALEAAFAHQADGSGVFESGQHPIIVGQAAYNTAYGTPFRSASWCNAPGTTVNNCDGYARIFDQGGEQFGFNTLLTPTAKLQIPIEPKALHDEMNAVAFDEFGRMTANIGIETVPATPGTQNVTLYPFVNPATELIDATNLPSTFNVTPIATQDGSQIWKITHNGVDTHPIHFHLYDVQVLNRVTWDNIILPPDPNELGWKDTVRISPLEDTIVALRPIIPTLPFEIPNSIRMLNPMMPAGSPAMFNNIDPQGNPTASILNQLVNFGWEYVWHCHILSHEEMDMMRPVSVAMPPNPPDGLRFSLLGSGGVLLSWNDNSIAETAHVVQRSNGSGVWSSIGAIPTPLNLENTKGPLDFTDNTAQQGNTYQYRLVAQNTVGYGNAFPSMTVESNSSPLTVVVPLRAPTALTATFQAGTGSATWLPPRVQLNWTDNATGETGFAIERANGGAFTQIATAPALAGTGTTTFIDLTVQPNTAYSYRVRALNGTPSDYSNTAAVTTPNFPAAPTIATITGTRVGNGPNDRVTLTWNNVAGETGYTVQRATNATFTAGLVTNNLGANVTSLTTGNVPRNTTFFFRVRAFNAASPSAWSAVRRVLTP